MSQPTWSLEKDLEAIRKNFPILGKGTYLISNSLGAMPRQAEEALEHYMRLWREKGVAAWEEEWWDLSRDVAGRVAEIIGAGPEDVTMMPSATQAHWVVLSTQFSRKPGKRRRVVATDQDFPSILYGLSRICEFMGWDLEVVPSRGGFGVDVQDVLGRTDEQTLFVCTSHVHFRSAFIQDVAQIARKAHEVGALTVIDGYHAPGTLPVDVRALGVDFYIGGCLKWLCGGPGSAFLYVRPDLRRTLEPGLTGWLAHPKPFDFSLEMAYTEGSYRFMSGTPPIPSLYTARAGLEAIQKVGISQIRKKSLEQTGRIISKARERGFAVHTPQSEEARGGAVSVEVPHAHRVSSVLLNRGVWVDFRKGRSGESDVIRVGPHFYTRNEEIESLFAHIDEILEAEDFGR
ncbi:MAG: aminotransferase class V-fold PLP-dependent enzyme [Candidatus Aminicenantales bacterium]